MTKLTTPKAILIGSFMITLAVLFRIDAAVIEEAKAEVAGMNYMALKSDYDFKKAVGKVVEKYCTVDRSGGISC